MTASQTTTRLIVRVDLRGAAPPIWRRLQIDPSLKLDRVHDVIQTAFGWTNGHLHEFTNRKPGGGRDYTRFVPAFLMDDDQFGADDVMSSLGIGGLFGLEVDEATVEVGSLLIEPKDGLDYQYDFGDSWDHKLRLERVIEVASDAPAAVCLAGRRAAPREDCGGIWQYLWLIEAGHDPAHPDYGEAREQLDWSFGEGAVIDPEAFNLDGINRRLVGAAAANFRTSGFDDDA